MTSSARKFTQIFRRPRPDHKVVVPGDALSWQAREISIRTDVKKLSAAFGVLSVVAAFTVSPLMLIVARALLGVAGATLAPSTLALITNMFRDERQRGKAIAIWATCQFTGGALGPVLAGFLLQRFWWGSVFLVAAAALAVVVRSGW